MCTTAGEEATGPESGVGVMSAGDAFAQQRAARALIVEHGDTDRARSPPVKG